MEKTAFVTGASSGIGEAAVRRLLADGFTVYAGARRTERMEPLASVGARIVYLDLTDEATIVASMARIEEETGRIDVLVNNAGYGSYGALEDVPLAEARRQCEVNLFGLARLCQLALPTMRRQHSGYIINVTSVGGKFGEPFGSWYHATKFAVEGLSDCLRMETAPFGIKIVVVEPGAIRTEWGGIAADSLKRMSGQSAYGPYARRHAKMLGRAEESRFPSPPETVARTIGRIVAKTNPRARYATGGGARTILFLRRMLPDRLFDRLIWRITQSMG